MKNILQVIKLWLMQLSQSHSRVLALLHREGRLSRSDLHERTGIRPNTIGDLVGDMLDLGLVRACESEPAGRGRPRVPVEIDPTCKHVIGLAIQPGAVELIRVNLCGETIGEPARQLVPAPDQLMAIAQSMLQAHLSKDTLAIGMSAPGLVDLDDLRIVASSAAQGLRNLSLKPLGELAGNRPLVLSSEVHALSARWQLLQRETVTEDVLVVTLRDGAFGASLLIHGRPNEGCVTSGNELGHTRLPIETDRCYCGQVGCLERIFSSAQLRRMSGQEQEQVQESHCNGTPLEQRIGKYHAGDSVLDELLGYVGMSIANACNFIRPHRVVLASPYAASERFISALIGSIRSQMMFDMERLIAIDPWSKAAIGTGETAAWLALVKLLTPAPAQMEAYA